MCEDSERDEPVGREFPTQTWAMQFGAASAEISIPWGDREIMVPLYVAVAVLDSSVLEIWSQMGWSSRVETKWVEKSNQPDSGQRSKGHKHMLKTNPMH